MFRGAKGIQLGRYDDGFGTLALGLIKGKVQPALILAIPFIDSGNGLFWIVEKNVRSAIIRADHMHGDKENSIADPDGIFWQFWLRFIVPLLGKLI